MSTSTIARFFALALVFALIPALVACTDQTDREEAVEDEIEEGIAPINPEVGMETPAADVTVDGTVAALQGGLMSLAIPTAIANVNGWINTLEAAEFEGSEEIADVLDELAEELGETPVDGEDVGELLARLGEQTTAAALLATGAQRTSLEQLGSALAAGSQQLMGM